MIKCSKCQKPLSRPESIIRGMGPICYGKTYVYKQLLKYGKTREEILKIPEEEILKWAKEEVKRYQKEIKKNNKRSNMRRLRLKRLKAEIKRDNNQTTLDLYLKNIEQEDDDVNDGE